MMITVMSVVIMTVIILIVLEKKNFPPKSRHWGIRRGHVIPFNSQENLQIHMSITKLTTKLQRTVHHSNGNRLIVTLMKRPFSEPYLENAVPSTFQFFS